MEHKEATATPAAEAATTTSSWNMPIHSRHEATALLMLHTLQGRVSSHGGARWILVPAPAAQPSAAAAASSSASSAAPSSPALSFVFTLVCSCGSAALRLRFVPLFDSTLVRSSLHLLQRQSSEAAPSSTSDSSAFEDAIRLGRTKVVELPSLTLPDPWPPSMQIPSAEGCTLASLPADVVARAAASMHSLVFETPVAVGPSSSSASFWAHLESARARARKTRIEEELFGGFLGQVLHSASASATAAAPSPSASATAEATPAVGGRTEDLLRFPAEPNITTTSAFVTLLHLLLVYEGFRSTSSAVEQGAAAAATSDVSATSTASASSLAATAAPATSSPAASLFPSNWSSFSSTQTLSYALAYKHLSLQGVLPGHEVRVKILRVDEDHFVLHAMFVSDTSPSPPQPITQPLATATAAAAETSVEAEAEQEEQEEEEEEKGQEVSMQPPSAPVPIAPSKIYSITFRPSEFLAPALLGPSSPVLPLPKDPSQLFRNLGALISQIRNRILKHMLGEEYRRALININNNSSAAAASAASAEFSEAAAAPCYLAQLPSELLLGILQLLPSSSDVTAIGHTCWALQYLSSHPLIWQQLCEREMPPRPPQPPAPPAAAAAGAAGGAAAAAPAVVHKTDWKNEFRARKLGKEALEAARAEESARLRQLMARQPWLGWGMGGGGEGGGGSGGGQHRWRPFHPPPIFHPTPFGVHPDAPFFILPALRY